MEIWLKYLIVIVLSYLLGSLNFSIIISKGMLGRDVRQFGSGNAGSTNAYRMMGGKKTLLVMAGDLLKGVLAVLLGGLLFGELGHFGGHGKLIAGLCVMLGHMFPIYFGFRGGKGVLTAAAVFGVFDVRILAIILSVFLIVVLLTRYVSLASMCAAAAVPVSMVIFYGFDAFYFPVALAIAALVIFLHRANIGRLLRHEEGRFSWKRKGSGNE